MLRRDCCSTRAALGREPGAALLTQLRTARRFWIPFVTFWQVSADLPFSTNAPSGHGRKYTTEYVDGWNAGLRPAGLTPQGLTELKHVISTVD